MGSCSSKTLSNARSDENPKVNPVEPQRAESLSVESMKPEWLEILARIPGAGLKGEGFPRNVLGMIMHNPETFGPFMNYWVTCKLEMGLTVREQEIVILRMGVLYKSNYVWKHHVKVGREFGLKDDEMNAIRIGEFESFVAREHSILCLTDEIVNYRNVSSELWQKHSTILSIKDIVDLIHLTSQYMFFAMMNNTFQVKLEPVLDTLPGINEPFSTE